MSEGSIPVRLSIRWPPEAQANLRAIDRPTALDILHCIDRYLATRNGDVKKLKPPMTGSGSAAATTASSSSRPENTSSASPASGTVETHTGSSVAPPMFLKHEKKTFFS